MKTLNPIEADTTGECALLTIAWIWLFPILLATGFIWGPLYLLWRATR